MFNNESPVILATEEVEMRRTMVRSQPRQIVYETLSQKNHHKKRGGGAAGGMARGAGPEFKP
jgi:hypothetical protein